jgi:hypothetical protein
MNFFIFYVYFLIIHYTTLLPCSCQGRVSFLSGFPAQDEGRTMIGFGRGKSP